MKATPQQVRDFVDGIVDAVLTSNDKRFDIVDSVNPLKQIDENTFEITLWKWLNLDRKRGEPLREPPRGLCVTFTISVTQEIKE